MMKSFFVVAGKVFSMVCRRQALELAMATWSVRYRWGRCICRGLCSMRQRIFS